MEHADFQMIDPKALEHDIDDLFEREDKVTFRILNEIVEVIHEREQVQGQ